MHFTDYPFFPDYLSSSLVQTYIFYSPPPKKSRFHMLTPLTHPVSGLSGFSISERQKRTPD